MRVRSALLAAGVATTAIGCGGSDDPPVQRALAPVVLEVAEPPDEAVVRTDSVQVRGTVSPAGAAVRVAGRVAEVDGGAFTASVALDPGANVIDVMATARGRAASLTALRVTRELPVEVPDLTGLGMEEAEKRLDEVGLRAEFDDGGGLFDGLLPGEPAVCEQDPEAGAEVRRGTVVTATVARQC